MKLPSPRTREKAMAKESAGCPEEAATAMKLAQDKREEGKLEMADKAERDASLKLEQAGKMLDKLAAAMPKPGDAERDLVKSMEDAKSLLTKPSPNSPLPSPEAMQQAAKAIRKTAELTGIPMVGRTPGGAGPANVNDDPLPSVLGPDWGNLPGEVRTRLPGMASALRAGVRRSSSSIFETFRSRVAGAPRAVHPIVNSA